MKIRERISSLFLNYKNVRLKEVLIDHDKYLGKQKNKPTIYLKNPSKFFISPFNMTFDEIDKLKTEANQVNKASQLSAVRGLT